MNVTRRLFSLHSWFGLLTGVFLLLPGLSGSLLVFWEEIDRLANRDLLIIELPTNGQKASTLPLSNFYRVITNRYPSLDGIDWLNPEDKPDDAYDFRLYLNDARLFTYDLGLISFNPRSG